jgi:hypothetical protein
MLYSCGKTLMGKQEYVSKENENVWKGTLAEICRMIVERAEDGLREIMTQSVDDNGSSGCGEISGAFGIRKFMLHKVSVRTSNFVSCCFFWS